MNPDKVLLKRLFVTMVRIRRFEETAKELFQKGRIKGTAQSCVGQEAIAAGACAALLDDDFIASNHRGHGHCIAKGARLDLMMAELMGREKRDYAVSGDRTAGPPFRQVPGIAREFARRGESKRSSQNKEIKLAGAPGAEDSQPRNQETA